MQTALVIGLSIAVFLALITNFTTKPTVGARWNIILASIALVGGFCIYGYGFLRIEHTNLAYAVIRTVHSTLHMFVSANEYADIRSAPGMEALPVMVLFWTIHSFAFYCTANAFIKLLGGEFLKKLRLFSLRFQDITLLYGMNDRSMGFLTELMKKEKGAFLVVDTADAASPYKEAIEDLGGLLLTSMDARSASPMLIKKAGFRKGKHNYRFFALHEESSENLYFANRLRDSMKEAGITPDQTSLVLFAGADSAAADHVQSIGKHYGFGSLSAFTHADLAARLMVRHYPPYEQVSFDEKGASTEVFDAVIVGFGAAGKAALRHLIMNSAFPGKGCHFAVFDPTLEARSGAFSFLYPGLSSLPVEYFAVDARSQTFFDYLNEHAKTLSYVALCCGSEKMNSYLDQTLRYGAFHFVHPLTIVHCTTEMVSCLRQGASVRGHHPIYSMDLLGNSALDGSAKRLNHKYYEGEGLTLEEAWNKADYFSRTSCKAFADFLPAFLAMAHVSTEDVQKGEEFLTNNPQLLEMLSMAEHLRWCYFHLCMGYLPMTEEELSLRLKLAERQRLAGEKITPPQKDTYRRRHACLVPWEELDLLSERVSAALASPRDYKQMDRNNVLLIPELVREEQKSRREESKPA